MSRDHAQSAETPFLELLARGASADAYEQPVLLARAEGGPAERTDALERAKHLALRVRSELEGRRRREAELSALFETAHDLAGLRDLDAVLRAIVQRARSLLGTDVTYLSLNDPDRGDTYMRVTEGSVAARFQQLRLGMGEGLGGLVAQTARPYVTDDYFKDARFQHTGTIDAGVRDEGLVAILGVPLMLGHHVIGVLFAADRRARVFEREQIALLGSFAALAAAAIDTANLLAETRSALAGLERANEIIRDRSGVIERASDVHDRLAELVLRGGGVHDVAAAVSQVLDGTVEFTEAAAAPEYALEASRADGHVVRHKDDWIAAVAAGDELFGALVLRGHPGLDPVDQLTLERAAMVTSLLLLARRSAAEAEQRVRGELLDDLLDARDRDPRLLDDRARRLHADLSATHVVLAARLDATETDADQEADARRRLWAAASHLAATRHGLAAARDGGTVLLLPLTDSDSATDLARRTARHLGRAVHEAVTVGASAPVRDLAARPEAVAAAYTEAGRCLDALRLLGRGGDGAAAEDFGFLGLLLAGDQDVPGFVDRTIGQVVAYDERRGTELVRTLDAYFACGMSPARTKEALHVHVNTVAQRLDRVGRLLGDDWQSPDRALEMQLALRLHRLSDPARH
ncbi:helix-turn-helix domain-containing protein [Streptomyces violaceoruber]|uniref:Helix-turn-helix domain-containing protein n=2 Tax=Streptomyces violaceoruber group TaxID=2867121 RepID=A0ABZ1LR03_9ACTN|nr:MULTISPECIES: GAF domain-containing protein [Streptomyces]MBQ0949127.1 helix-turn-helix domain-containing protein [Streptomyces sp. RK76]MDX3322993.1 helix-turn-helix domain-containing protein [Streptomyces sp. ME03-5684b]WSB64831.1 helix-turn-helix domain-containing protein [Streptomyces anthocyanicus]WTC07333.1 helix-turn-helix domain-containing protein [Streptomyces anthocyanicus]WTC52520.1 helix-turn-helix domain-containing protein [Streptomyces anthocyanicus]